MKPFTAAVVEQNRVTDRIPDRRELHCTRTTEREVQAAGLAVSFDDYFVELKGPGHEMLALADRPFHEITQIVQRCNF